MRVVRYGQRAWLLEVADACEVRCVDAALQQLRTEGPGIWASIVDVVPAARSVLVTASCPTDATALREPLAGLIGVSGRDIPVGRTVEIPVTYDGPDLESVAWMCGLGVDEVVAAHTSTVWTVAFGGFAPGFAYLGDGDPRLRVGRHRRPRTTVPAGAVALADDFSAVYPRRSPGGWQVIGTTTTVMWDENRDEPALLRPGMRVAFRALP